MRNAGYTDVAHGKRGITEKHLTVTQFKVQREQERLDTLTAQADQQKQRSLSGRRSTRFIGCWAQPSSMP